MEVDDDVGSPNAVLRPVPCPNRNMLCLRCGRAFSTEFNLKRVRTCSRPRVYMSYIRNRFARILCLSAQHFFCADKRERELLKQLAANMSNRPEAAKGTLPPAAVPAVIAGPTPPPVSIPPGAASFGHVFEQDMTTRSTKKSRSDDGRDDAVMACAPQPYS